MRGSPRRFGWVVSMVAVLVAGAVVALAPPGAQAQVEPRPLIFVHGVLGSANQFESQSMRFASNGYPIDHVVGFDYDSLAIGANTELVRGQLDALIASLQAETGSEQVDLVGHSLGTSVLQGYLNSSAERAADVAHYVNLDGFPAASLPGGVTTLAVWGQGNDARELVGAQNVHFPDQTHTQVVTSPETFEVMFEFLTGAAPDSRDIVRQRAGEIALSGRAHLFPSNAPVDRGDLEIYEVDATTGMRSDATPEATFALTDGSWGPFLPDPAKHYEFAIVRDGNAHHLYFEPFVRSSSLMRLLTSEPGQGLDGLWERGPGHSNIVLLRNKEWWGDQPGANDELTVDGVDVVSPATAPMSKRALAAFVWDIGVDQVSNPGVPAPAFEALPFLTGVDIYVPAAAPPDDTVTVRSVPRLGDGLVVVVNVPNWPSDTDRTTIQFNDFTVTADPPPLPEDTTTTTTAPTPTSVPPTTTVPAATVPQPVRVSPTLAG
jgi:pimeloyl-ACP methyl ester carboxylesterase